MKPRRFSGAGVQLRQLRDDVAVGGGQTALPAWTQDQGRRPVHGGVLGDATRGPEVMLVGAPVPGRMHPLLQLGGQHLGVPQVLAAVFERGLDAGLHPGPHPLTRVEHVLLQGGAGTVPGCGDAQHPPQRVEGQVRAGRQQVAPDLMTAGRAPDSAPRPSRSS